MARDRKPYEHKVHNGRTIRHAMHRPFIDDHPIVTDADRNEHEDRMKSAYLDDFGGCGERSVTELRGGGSMKPGLGVS